MRLSAQPAFVEVAETQFNTGNDLAAADALQVAKNAAFAAARTEDFWGYFKHSETVALPVSPIDGYEYTRAECYYTWMVYWTGAPPAGALNGTQTAPARGATSAGGHLLKVGGFVDQATGAVSCDEAYETERLGASPVANHDGILIVFTHAKRSR